MAGNIKRRFTVSLDIDTKDAEKQIKSTVGNLKTILDNIGTASDKMGVFKELADYLSQIERGKRTPSFKRMELIATALNIEVYKLFKPL